MDWGGVFATLIATAAPVSLLTPFLQMLDLSCKAKQQPSTSQGACGTIQRKNQNENPVESNEPKRIQESLASCGRWGFLELKLKIKVSKFQVSKVPNFQVSSFQSLKVPKFQKSQSFKASKCQSFNFSNFQSFKVSKFQNCISFFDKY